MNENERDDENGNHAQGRRFSLRKADAVRTDVPKPGTAEFEEARKRKQKNLREYERVLNREDAVDDLHAKTDTWLRLFPTVNSEVKDSTIREEGSAIHLSFPIGTFYAADDVDFDSWHMRTGVALILVLLHQSKLADGLKYTGRPKTRVTVIHHIHSRHRDVEKYSAWPMIRALARTGLIESVDPKRVSFSFASMEAPSAKEWVEMRLEHAPGLADAVQPDEVDEG